jgi:hypothetical protein
MTSRFKGIISPVVTLNIMYDVKYARSLLNIDKLQSKTLGLLLKIKLCKYIAVFLIDLHNDITANLIIS